jgi:murein L,D-transpeptidase YafK
MSCNPLGGDPVVRLRLTILALLLVLLGVPAAADTGWRADKILVKKEARRLYLLKAGAVVREYPIMLGDVPEGPKRERGDQRTPEGRYVIDWRNPQSRFHKALHISYPSVADRLLAAAADTDPGGDIMIHGLPNKPRLSPSRYLQVDWTDGCIAVANPHMDEIWEAVADGTPIEILP